ncbi:MAG TPA: hypothetical protein VKR78_00030, partial [Acidimicrobiales bacterium]|nr:hypothetical protein [Acidimicrobiales bacterium]
MSGRARSHPAELADRLVRAARRPCVAIVEESSDADVRYANNTVTTDGVREDRRVTAVLVEPADDAGQLGRAGVARRSGDVDVDALVAEAEAALGPADDAAALVEGHEDPDFAADPAVTGLDRLSAVVAGLARAFSRVEGSGTVLSGFAEHHVTTTYIATSTGLRRRHVQPTGALQLVGRKDGASAWAGVGSADFLDVELESLEEEVRRGLSWSARR